MNISIILLFLKRSLKGNHRDMAIHFKNNSWLKDSPYKINFTIFTFFKKITCSKIFFFLRGEKDICNYMIGLSFSYENNLKTSQINSSIQNVRKTNTQGITKK